MTNYSTGSTQEKAIYFDAKIRDLVGATLSSNLFFWYYQIYSDNLHIKSFEIESFFMPVNRVNDELLSTIKTVYDEYLNDIEKNANVRKTTRYANIDCFKEYKIGKSKRIVDKIDDLIGPLYGLSTQEIAFLKDYEILFRLNDDTETGK